MDRATKKVKSRELGDGCRDVLISVQQGGSPKNFREALLMGEGESVWEIGSGSGTGSDDFDVSKDKITFRDGGAPVVHVSDEEIQMWSKKWANTLVVSVMGKRVAFKVLENKINRDWAKKGKVRIIDMPRGFYAVQFSAEEDYRHALFEGPWMVAGNYLIVQRWRPNFLSTADVERKVAVWIRIPELALELYNYQFLSRFAAVMGKFLKMDNLTSIHSRGQFARICVEVDLSKPLIPQVEVRGVLYKIEYEGLHLICFKCGVYGHRKDTCVVGSDDTGIGKQVDGGDGTNLIEIPSKEIGATVVVDHRSSENNQIEVIRMVSKDTSTAPPEKEVIPANRALVYGDFMLPKRKIRRKFVKMGEGKNLAGSAAPKDAEKNISSASGSRFNSLNDLDLIPNDTTNNSHETGQVSKASGKKTNVKNNHMMDKSSGHGVSGAKKKNGPRLIILGPRMKDVKKVPRLNNPGRKSSHSVEAFSKFRENLRPKAKRKEKNTFKYGEVSLMTRESQRKNKGGNVCAEAVILRPEIEDGSSSGQGNSNGGGTVDSSFDAVSQKVIDGSNCKEMPVGVNVEGLSEPKSKLVL